MILPCRGIISGIGEILRRFPGQRTCPQGRHLPQGAGTHQAHCFLRQQRLCYYETFFQVQFKEQDFYLERGYFDLLEWLPETVPLHQYLERGQFNQLIYKVYQNTSTYSLEQLCEMEKKIKLKHIRLWNEKKIQYSVTRFSNIIQDLLDAGVNTYFVYPKYEILQESVTLLLQEIHLKTIVQNQKRHHGLKPAVFRRRLCHGSPAFQRP